MSKEFNGVIAELTAMRTEYAAAGGADKKAEIKKKFAAQKEKADALVGQLISAAEAAYQEAPNADTEVTKVLAGTVFDDIENDDYEPAFPLAKLLVDNKCPDPFVAKMDNGRTMTFYPTAMAGIAAYCVNEYDLAETWLKAAAASGELAKLCDDIKQLEGAEAAAVLYHVAADGRRGQEELGEGKEDSRHRGQDRRPAARAIEDKQGRHRHRTL